jgi:hypothetical protein
MPVPVSARQGLFISDFGHPIFLSIPRRDFSLLLKSQRNFSYQPAVSVFFRNYFIDSIS